LRDTPVGHVLGEAHRPGCDAVRVLMTNTPGGLTMSLDLLELLPDDWRMRLDPLVDPLGLAALSTFVGTEYEQRTVYPPQHDLFNAFRLCSYADARVLILGQDPYHGHGQAHGLSFSVREGVRHPPSLRNVFKELAADMAVPPPACGNLSRWARQGVL